MQVFTKHECYCVASMYGIVVRNMGAVKLRMSETQQLFLTVLLQCNNVDAGFVGGGFSKVKYYKNGSKDKKKYSCNLFSK